MAKPTKTQYSFEFKKRVVERCLAGETKPDLALELQISSPKLIGTWLRQYRAEGEAGLQSKGKGRPKADPASPPRQVSELARMRRENERLRAENAYLKKLRDLREQGLV